MKTTKATVAIPWRPTPDRIPAKRRCTNYWKQHGYPIVYGDSDPTKPFNRSQARNNAVQLATTDTVIVADADVTPAHHAQIRQAIHLAQQGIAVTPYSLYRLLPADAVATHDLTTIEPIREYTLKARPAGITVVTRHAYETVGGYDEQFAAGWGYEDAAFILACQTLIGTQTLDGILYAFNHEGRRKRDPHNKRRYWWYQRANGNPDLMRQLTKGATNQHNWPPRRVPSENRRLQP